jgi:hypothetical protein
MTDKNAADTKNAPESYGPLFGILAFLILLATALLAVGGVYFSFINPSF